MRTSDENVKEITLNCNSERDENNHQNKRPSSEQYETDRHKIVNYTVNMPFTIKIY